MRPRNKYFHVSEDDMNDILQSLRTIINIETLFDESELARLKPIEIVKSFALRAIRKLTEEEAPYYEE